jgi:hypothetical protein
MPEQNRPASKELAPDPSNNYERSHPEREAGQGRMDAPKPPAAKSADNMPGAVQNAQDGSKQLNAHDAESQKTGGTPAQPEHSMLEEEPLGWDQSPQGKADGGDKRHPRTGGLGGTPNVGAAEKTS